jgi:hypothetical protein
MILINLTKQAPEQTRTHSTFHRQAECYREGGNTGHYAILISFALCNIDIICSALSSPVSKTTFYTPVNQLQIATQTQ